MTTCFLYKTSKVSDTVPCEQFTLRSLALQIMTCSYIFHFTDSPSWCSSTRSLFFFGGSFWASTNGSRNPNGLHKHTISPCSSTVPSSFRHFTGIRSVHLSTPAEVSWLLLFSVNCTSTSKPEEVSLWTKGFYYLALQYAVFRRYVVAPLSIWWCRGENVWNF